MFKTLGLPSLIALLIGLSGLMSAWFSVELLLIHNAVLLAYVGGFWMGERYCNC